MFYTLKNHKQNNVTRVSLELNSLGFSNLHNSYLPNNESLFFNGNPNSVVQPIYVFKKDSESVTATYKIVPLVRRLSNLSGFNISDCNIILNKVIFNLVNNLSFHSLYFFLTRLFWIIPVPKHKQVLYLIRALIKVAHKNSSAVTGISITLRGKLAATGNKRKSTFVAAVGVGSAARLDSTNISDFRLIRTATGVLGVTSIITYTR